MRFETSQHMKLGQQMKLAPRMIQSMEILQMPLAELAERIEQELETNPTLELVEGDPDADARDQDPVADDHADAPRDGDADFERLDDFESSNPDGAENAFDGADRRTWEDDGRHEGTYSASRMAGERDAKTDAMASAPARAASLHEQLLRQWALIDVDVRLLPLGEMIIHHLDDDGYLRTTLEEIADRAPADRPVAAADLEPALQAVQLFLEPAGIGARDARECLLLQLDATEAGPDGDRRTEVARRLVADHMEDLSKNRLPRIASRTGLGLDEIKDGLEVLRRLSLAPARRLLDAAAEPITPDAIVEYDDDHDRYVCYLADSRLPSLRINREYAMMSRDRALPKRDREFLKTNLGNAQWLLDAVQQRRRTLLRVLSVVVEEQREYFDFGPENLRPLPMTQVAERLGIHVATVSRAVADKYVQTPRGVVPLRGFFSGGLTTESGEDMSYDAVKAALRDVVDNEDKASPLSDEAIVKALKDRGIEIARRTVAKYRGQLDIPPARMRREF